MRSYAHFKHKHIPPLQLTELPSTCSQIRPESGQVGPPRVGQQGHATGQGQIKAVDGQAIGRPRRRCRHAFRCRRNGQRLEAFLEAGDAVGGGAPGGQAAVVVDEPRERVLHPAEGRGDLDQLAELDGTGTVRRRFIYGTRVNVPDVVLDVVTGEAWRLLHDQLGSPRLVIDIDSGAVVAEREWDEFGRVLVDTAPGLLPFGYAGGLEDIDTGLIRFGARDYDADAGRWTTKDPISFAGGTTNLYEYVGNQPVNHIDPTGLFVPGALVVAALGAEAFGIGSISVAAASVGGIATAVGVSLGAAAVGTAVALSVEAGVGGPSGNPFAVPSGIEGESITDDAEMCTGGSGQPPQLPPHEEGPQPRRDCGSELRAALQVVANAPPPVRTSLELAARARYKACIDAGGDP